MSEITGSNVPDLSHLTNGHHQTPQKVGGFGQMFLIKSADNDGAFLPEKMEKVLHTSPTGQLTETVNITIGRDNLVTAEDLVEMIVDELERRYDLRNRLESMEAFIQERH